MSSLELPSGSDGGLVIAHQCLGTSFLRDGMVDKSLNGRLMRVLWIPLCLGGIVACSGIAEERRGLAMPQFWIQGMWESRVNP